MAAFLLLSTGECIASEGCYNVLPQEWFPVPPTAAPAFLVFYPTLSKEEALEKQEMALLAVSYGAGGVGELVGSFSGQLVKFLVIAADCRY